MLYYASGSEESVFNNESIKEALYTAFEKIGSANKILAIPPDFTRFHSRAGLITRYAYNYYKERMTDILPAIGTHFAMTEKEIEMMFGDVPKSLFCIHKWKEDLTELGIVPSEYVQQVSEGKVDFNWRAQVNKLLVEGGYDLILSIGQVVPHEVVGMANHNKNIFVGTGGKDAIHKSHFLGAVYGMERMMGRKDTPVKRVLNYASEHFAKHLPLVYILTVIGKDVKGSLVVRGLFIGDDIECFNLAADLSLKVNFNMMENQLKKIVVYLDPLEFKSTWLGNKSIYRTRMAIADDGDLIVLAPGLREFGEDKEIDKLIRKYGYRPSSTVLRQVSENDDLKNNLAAAAHLIHGSPEERFTVTYCTGYLTRDEIEGVGFCYSDLNLMMNKYNPAALKDGYNIVDGEEIFYISNPALGLWSYKDKFIMPV